MRAAACLLGVVLSACDKVPIVDVNAQFSIADVTWFEEEATMFVFYVVHSEQGLNDASRVEISFTTDDAVVPWTPLDSFTRVHEHVPVSCGVTGRCGSTSFRVDEEPRDVRLRLRYHPDGELALPATTHANIVRPGLPQRARSLVVYGVFDGANRQVQWRGRHQFPALRNQQATQLGLRRWFSVEEQRHGDVDPSLFAGNPYGYGFADACPTTLLPVGAAAVATSERAVFEATAFDDAVLPSAAVCGRSTVRDALGTFEAPALARKNPQVESAFPVLRSPIAEGRHLGFVLAPCQRTISERHLAMQRQRLQLEDAEVVCIDDWPADDFVATLASRLESRIDAERAVGDDMVLTLALHHDATGTGFVDKVEDALSLVLSPEAERTSPHAVGAFVFDSTTHRLQRPELDRLVLWCPSVGNNPNQQSCALQADIPTLTFGPLRFNLLPILTTRAKYLDFISRYSEAQAGRTRDLTFLAPRRTPTSQTVALGDFAQATFFDDEAVSADPSDSFSYCVSASAPVVFRMSDTSEPLPLELLPEVHAAAPQATYDLGLAWDFPFLVRLEYEMVVAGAASAFSLTVPFGIRSSAESYYGSELWTQGEVDLGEVLLRCSRYCDHPFFDSAGVYNVSLAFDPHLRNDCYRPRFPEPGDGGFPRDP